MTSAQRNVLIWIWSDSLVSLTEKIELGLELGGSKRK